jgi:hypothetical protein
MAKRFLTPVAFPVLDSDPENVKGAVYFNRIAGALKLFDGNSWLTLATTSEIPVVGIDGGFSSTTLFDIILNGGNASTTIFDSMLDAGAATV